MLALVVAFSAAFALAAATPLRWVAVRFDILDRPGQQPQKGHATAVPYLGGLAILIGAGLALLLFDRSSWSVVVLLAFVAAIGLGDDIWYAPVWVKLLGEGAIAAAAIALGFSWQLTDSVPLNDLFTLVWIVGLTNSFNLLDNMDGLASVVAACSLAALSIIVPPTALLALPLAGAAIGFFVVNRPPARMYMGDAGSLMLGFGVALCTVAAANSTRGLHSLVILCCPVALAIFDTSLVIVSRIAKGRPVQLGGRDHFSHRLRQLRWSPYQVLAAAAGACAGSGVIAFFALSYPLPIAWLAVPLALGYVAAWGRLLMVDPYSSEVRPRLELNRARERP